MSVPQKNLARQNGFSMVEVLVTLVILLVGLLGLAGVMVQGQRSEVESYQRVQALILLQDMAARINANRNAATCYAYTTNTTNGTPYLGTTGTGVKATPVPATACTSAAIIALYSTISVATATLQATTAVNDMNAWHNTLLGASETSSGANVGAMVGARGCVSYNSTATPANGGPLLNPVNGAQIPGTGVYTISVAWQGLGNTAIATPNCGQGLYGASDAMRRVVSLTIRIASLTT